MGDITQMQDSIEHIRHRIDNVSANGTPGLENSLKDIFGKITLIHTDIQELKDVTESGRTFREWRAVTKRLLHLPIFGTLKTKTGKAIWTVILLLVVNTILHTAGIQFDIVEIVKKVAGG